MKKVICALLCIFMCGCALNEPDDVLVSGDIIDSDIQSETKIDAEVETQDETIELVYDYRFEKAVELDGLKLDCFWSGGLYSDAVNLDEEGKLILYKHRGDSLEKLERVPYGYIDEFGESTVTRAIYSTRDGECVWFMGLVGEYDGKYILCNEFLPATVYLISEDGAEDILPNEAFGFTRQEFQESDNYSFEWGWAEYLSDSPQVCGKMLAYTSDKFVTDGKMVHNKGIWVIDLETREEYRIGIESEKYEFWSVDCWIDEDTLIFGKGNEFYVHKPSMGADNYELIYTVDEQKYGYAHNVFGTHLILSEIEGHGVKIIELEDMTEHEFALDRERGWSLEYYDNKYVATAENKRAVIVLDLETDTFEIYEWYFEDGYIESAYFDDNGDIIVVAGGDAMTTIGIEGIYKLIR